MLQAVQDGWTPCVQYQVHAVKSTSDEGEGWRLVLAGQATLPGQAQATRETHAARLSEVQDRMGVLAWRHCQLKRRPHVKRMPHV